MPIRFNRSVKIAPGMRLNFSGSGTSLSVGGRGATVNFSKRGTRATLGIPGTGLSHSFSSRTPSRRAIDRQQEREERERIRAEALSRVRVSVDDEGVLICLDAHGSPLRGRDLALLWEQEGKSIHALLLSAVDEINGDMELLDGIHLDMPYPSPTTLLEPVPVAEFEPEKPREKRYPEEPRFVEPESPKLISRLLGGKRRHARRAAEAQDLFDVQHQTWRSKCVDIDSENDAREENWQHARKEWIEKVERNRLENIERENNHRENLKNHDDYTDTVIQGALATLEWPRETLIAHRVDATNQTIWIDLDLPEIEDLPQRIASLASSGKKLTVKAKSKM